MHPGGMCACQAPWSEVSACLQISKDEEELARKRMEVKRGLPLQDLSGKRGFPDDPRLAANEKMQAEVQYISKDAQYQTSCHMVYAGCAVTLFEPVVYL